MDVTAAVGDLSEWITHDNQSIKFYKALNELQGREKRQFIKQYSQSYMNGEIDNTDVWGYLINETSPIFVRNFFINVTFAAQKSESQQQTQTGGIVGGSGVGVGIIGNTIINGKK